MNRLFRWSMRFVGTLSLTLSCIACSTESDDASSDAVAAGKGQVQIFSWWTKGGEQEALNALIGLYRAKYPDSDVVNRALDTGDQAKMKMTELINAGTPPDAFQMNAGSPLMGNWVRYNGSDDSASKIESIDALYDAEGWRTVVPKPLQDSITCNNHIYAVPINIHRCNALFYNKKILSDNGLEPPQSLEDFYRVGDALKAKNITPLAIGFYEPWTLSFLFETTVLGTTSEQFYNDFYVGKANLDDPMFRSALEAYVKIISYSNVEDDGATLKWDTASDRVYDGTAAFTMMGDWVTGYFQAKGWKADVDFGEVPSPGTSGYFTISSDVFALPKGAQARENAINFLRIVGSVEGQNAFNVIKGSIPARTDITDTSKYNSISQKTIQDFASAKYVMSGETITTPRFNDQLLTIVKQLAVDRSIDGFLFGLKNFYETAKQ